MALIKCSECGKEISDKAGACIHCGAPNEKIQSKNNVIIHSYDGSGYAVHPKVKVFNNNELIMELESDKTYELCIHEDCTLVFKCSIRKAKANVLKDSMNEITLDFNSFSGVLSAINNTSPLKEDIKSTKVEKENKKETSDEDEKESSDFEDNKKMTEEQKVEKNDTTKKQKSKKVGLFIGLFVLIIIGFFAIMIINEEKEEKFYKTLSGSWSNQAGVTITFFYNKTCSVYYNLGEYSSAAKTTNCKYDVSDDRIHLTFDVTLTLAGKSASDTANWEFSYNKDITELKRTDMTDITEAAKVYKRGNVSSVTNKVEEKKRYYQTYNLINLQNRGKKATITFGANNKCVVDFSQLNNRSSGTDYMKVTYNYGTCTYQTDDDINFTIDYNGTIEVAYYYYHSYYRNWQKNVLNSGYTMKNAKIKFSEDYSQFEFTNGKWDGQTGEIYYYFFKEN